MFDSIRTYLRIGAWVVAALLAGYLALLHYQMRALKAQTVQYRQSAAMSQAAVDELKKDRARTNAVQGAVAAENQSIAENHDAIKEEISHAPASEDGPVAPVLRHALDRLRRTPAAHAAIHSQQGAGQSAYRTKAARNSVR